MKAQVSRLGLPRIYVLNTKPPTTKDHDSPKSGKQAKKCLQLLLKPAGKQRDRSGMGGRLASALLGRTVDLRQDGQLWDRATRSIIVEYGNTWSMVNPEGGETYGPMGPRRAANYAYLLARASANGNHVSGMMGQGDSQDWQGGTALFKPSLRLDPNYAETMRRRSRKEAKTRVKRMEDNLPATEAVAMAQGYTWRLGWKLLTLTFPHRSSMRTTTQLKIFNGAFRRLTKMDLWGHVWGGVKGVEDKLTGEGAHVHGHLLLLMRYTKRNAIMQAWREAIDAEVKSRKLLPLDWPDELACVDIRIVKENPAKRPDAVSWEIALDEVSKYITKTTDLLAAHPVTGSRVDAETLLELCDVRRWPRMFELLGKARSAAATAKRAFLDTSCISAAKVPVSDVNGNQTGEENWLQLRLERIFGVVWDEDGLFQLPQEPDEPPPRSKGVRPDTWRDLMTTLPLAEWCRVIDVRAEKAVKFRLRQLKGTFSRLYLQDLNGIVVANQNLDVF